MVSKTVTINCDKNNIKEQGNKKKILSCLQGAETNHTDHQGMSAVHWGVVRGHLDVVRLLVQCSPLNAITLDPHKSDHNNRMILVFVYCS